ncbi:MAG: TOBE domain-containing protein [Methylomonas sp.]
MIYNLKPYQQLPCKPMPEKNPLITNVNWLEGDLRLVGADSRMMNLLAAIHQSGSINQAAKQVGLSYKGAWQMIERANNLAPKVLISTATGGSKGGGTCLTAAGLALLQLFERLQQQHQAFLQQLNQSLMEDVEIALLLKSLTIKTTASNQLFATITAIQLGAVNAELIAQLKGGEQIVASLDMHTLDRLQLALGQTVLMLINSPEVSLVSDYVLQQLSARNVLHGKLIRIQQDQVNAEVILGLAGGDSFVVRLSSVSAEQLGLKLGDQVAAVFKSNAVMVASLNKV